MELRTDSAGFKQIWPKYNHGNPRIFVQGIFLNLGRYYSDLSNSTAKKMASKNVVRIRGIARYCILSCNSTGGSSVTITNRMFECSSCGQTLMLDAKYCANASSIQSDKSETSCYRAYHLFLNRLNKIRVNIIHNSGASSSVRVCNLSSCMFINSSRLNASPK